MTLEEANKYADEMDKLNDEREEFIKKLARVRCSDKHREFIEWLLTEENSCDTCEYEEASIYCKENCPHEAKIEQEPILDKIIDDIQTLRGCSCANSDGIIDDVEDIIDKYRKEG